MSSATAPLQVEEELQRTFTNAVEGESVGIIQVQVKNECLVLCKCQSSKGNVASDFAAVESSANDEASYFLMKIRPKEWILITYVPEEVAVKDKMVYASAKGTLKDKFGHAFIVEEIHATSKDELSYDNFQGAQKPNDARSDFEIEKERVLEEENKEREEMVEKMSKITTGGSGGYHSVNIPLASNAKTALNRFKMGEVNFISLSIDENQSLIISVDAKNVDLSKIMNEIHLSEPKFYLYSQPGKTAVFIYSCPPKSPPKLRMVYSTAKPGVVSQVTQSGIQLAPKKIEITDGNDLIDELKDAQSSPSRISQSIAAKGNLMTGRMNAPSSGTPAFGGTVKASNLPTVNSQHAIYGLMAKPGAEGSSTKKKIVIPPRAAWNL